MVALRGALPLFLTGSTGVALLGFGLTGLSSVDPELQRAASEVQQQQAPLVHRLADCPVRHDHRPDPDAV